MEYVISAASVIIAFTAIIFSSRSLRLNAIKEYYAAADSLSNRKNRQVIFDLLNSGDSISIHNESASNVIAFFNAWSILVKKYYLPKWIFKGMSAYSARDLYVALAEYIEVKRHRNPLYAKDFEWLYKSVLEKSTDKLSGDYFVSGKTLHVFDKESYITKVECS